MRKPVLLLSAPFLLAATAPDAQDECALPPAQVSSALSLAMYETLHTEDVFIAAGPVPLAAKAELARATFRAVPKTGYLPSALSLPDTKAVPLHAGAPIVTWRDANGLKQCAIGWRNGLFGGATGEGHLRWVCFEDRDGDGALDLAWRPHSKSMGLSYQRLDIPLDQPVRLAATAPLGTSSDVDRRATVPELAFNQKLVVGKLADGFVHFDHMLGQRGLWVRASRKKAPLSSENEVEIAGARIRVRPGPGGATAELLGPNLFLPTLGCDATKIRTGGDIMAISYTFSGW
ncbi:MAG: hypothetical protein M3Q08_13070 [Pseudomonadota bacterium]|nr:hypothetical protein [Pseudomonadota bacterium]